MSSIFDVSFTLLYPDIENYHGKELEEYLDKCRKKRKKEMEISLGLKDASWEAVVNGKKGVERKQNSGSDGK